MAAAQLVFVEHVVEAKKGSVLAVALVSVVQVQIVAEELHEVVVVAFGQ